MKDYKAIASCFEKALGDAVLPLDFKNAIRIMKNRSEFCNKISCWDETMWLIIEDFLNGGGQIAKEEYFFQACALLEIENVLGGLE